MLRNEQHYGLLELFGLCPRNSDRVQVQEHRAANADSPTIHTVYLSKTRRDLHYICRVLGNLGV